MSLVRPFNRGRVNPIYKAGAVHINAKLNAIDNAERMRRMAESMSSVSGTPFSSSHKRQPYFSAPLGEYARSFSVCEVAELAFRNRDYTELEMQRGSDMAPPSFSSDIAVAVMSSLNLLGEYNAQLSDADMREAIAQKLQIFGVVIADNRDNNESNLTLMIDGVYTAQNNGTQYIPPGWVIATVPKRSDVYDNRVGRGYAEETDGKRATLVYEPYDASIHRNTPQRVYNCWKLQNSNAEVAKDIYLHSYLELTNRVMHSVAGIVAMGLGVLASKIPQGGNIAAGDIQKFQSEILKPATQGHKELIDAVFVAYGDKRNTLNTSSIVANPELASAIGEYMYACGKHVQVVLERVVGRALVGSAPREDFDMNFLQPSR